MGVGDGLDYGQPQSGATLVALRPAAGAAGEAVEDVAGVAGGQAGPVVGDPQAQQAIGAGAGDAAADAQGRPLRRVIDGVGRDLEHRLHNSLAVDGRGGLGDLLHQPLAVAQGLRLGFQFQGEVGDVDGPGDDEVRPLRPRQGQQLGDYPRHAVQLRRRQIDRPLALLAGGALEQLQLAADDGDRRAQLMAGVVDEAALGRVGGLQAIEHPVERQRQLGDVVAAGHRHAPRQVGVLDASGHAADLAHRRQDLPGDQPRDEQRQQQTADGHAGDDAHLVVDLRPLGGGEGRDDQMIRIGASRQRDLAPMDASVGVGFEDAGRLVGLADRPQQLAVAGQPAGVHAIGARAPLDLQDLIADDARDDLIGLRDLPRQEHLEQARRRLEGLPRLRVGALHRESAELLDLLLDLRVRTGFDLGQHDRSGGEDDREQHDAQQHHDPRDDPPSGGEPGADDRLIGAIGGLSRCGGHQSSSQSSEPSSQSSSQSSFQSSPPP